MFLAKFWRLLVAFAAIGLGGAICQYITPILGIIVIVAMIIGGVHVENRYIRGRVRPAPAPTHGTDSVAPQ